MSNNANPTSSLPRPDFTPARDAYTQRTLRAIRRALWLLDEAIEDSAPEAPSGLRQGLDALDDALATLAGGADATPDVHVRDLITQARVVWGGLTDPRTRHL